MRKDVALEANHIILGKTRVGINMHNLRIIECGNFVITENKERHYRTMPPQQHTQKQV